MKAECINLKNHFIKFGSNVFSIISNQKNKGIKSFSKLATEVSNYNADKIIELQNENIELNKYIKNFVKSHSIKQGFINFKQNSILIKTSASSISPTISFMFGYAKNINKFGFITEAGVNFNFNKIGSNNKKEIEVKNKYNLYLSHKLGYSFANNSLTYITLGLGLKDYNIKYKSVYNHLGNNTNLTSFILGAGHEFKIMTDKFGIFFETNSITPLKKIDIYPINIKLNSYEVKAGVRYYFQKKFLKKSEIKKLKRSTVKFDKC